MDDRSDWPKKTHIVKIAWLDGANDKEVAYQQKGKTAFDGSQGKAKMPYGVALGFTEHLAVKNPGQLLELTGVVAGPGSAAVDIPVMARGLRSGDGMASRRL